MPVRASLVRIGNSRGVRIPKSMIDEAGLPDAVELDVVDGAVVIRPAVLPRKAWDAAFERMAQTGDDELLDAELQTVFDEAEWEWPDD